jgi:hypothetical protein
MNSKDLKRCCRGIIEALDTSMKIRWRRESTYLGRTSKNNSDFEYRTRTGSSRSGLLLSSKCSQSATCQKRAISDRA